MSQYVHGYSDREAQRLWEQSGILEGLLHEDTTYPAGSTVLEAGCGVGAQTLILARRSPGARITSIDISPEYLERARRLVAESGSHNVTFRQADVLDLPLAPGSFDHVFVCFVLEHLADPVAALVSLKRVLKPGGSLTVIEGDHGACVWNPETAASLLVWQSLIREQQRLGHDPLIGRRLYPLLRQAGYEVKEVAPRCVYADGGHRALLEAGVSKIIVPMVETARQAALASGLIDETTWRAGMEHFQRLVSLPGGTFFYSWFKGVAVKPSL
jgi:ubiquinone/menaquinone biosynthesis C-methylase UbiE